MSAVARFREPRVHDERFLKRLRQCPCVVPRCSRPAEAAHIGMADYSRGVVESGHAKPHDFYCLPCCAVHHRESAGAEHVVGTENFWRTLGLDPYPLAAQLYALHQQYPHDIDAIPKMKLAVLRARFSIDE